MIQEKLCEQAKVLAINFAKMTIYFKYGDVVLAVNFIARWLGIPAALGNMALQYSLTLHVF